MSAVTTHDPAEAARLLARGGRLRRLAHDMAADLSHARLPEEQAEQAGMVLAALGSDARAIAEAAAEAVPPGHVDFGIWSGVDRVDYWRRLLAGEGPCGPIIDASSRMIRDRGGRIAGVVVVTRMAASTWWSGGPWIPEIFVVADRQNLGLGGQLLGHAVRTCRERGHHQLGLTVSDGNPARRLYERFGFEPFRSTWLIEGGR